MANPVLHKCLLQCRHYGVAESTRWTYQSGYSMHSVINMVLPRPQHHHRYFYTSIPTNLSVSHKPLKFIWQQSVYTISSTACWIPLRITFYIWYAGVFADCKVTHNVLDCPSQLLWCILWRNTYISPPIPFMNSKCYGLHSLWHFMGFWGWASSPASSGVTIPPQQTTSLSRYTSLKLTPLDVVAW